MEIPDIKIPDIYIPDVPEPYTPHYLTITTPPEIDVSGCTYQHRDIKNTGNRNLLLEDPNGVFTTCDFPFPSFIPLDYTPENLVITEEPLVDNEPPPFPETKPPKIPDSPPDPPPPFPPCPGPKDQRIGQYASELKLERVIGHKRSEDKTECITLYEDVKFIEKYIPNPPQLISTAAIAAVAATTPLLLNIVKPLVKNLIKKLTKKKNK
jgi:hypothetical protein